MVRDQAPGSDSGPRPFPRGKTLTSGFSGALGGVQPQDIGMGSLKT
jgi:hypothetical protein